MYNYRPSHHVSRMKEIKTDITSDEEGPKVKRTWRANAIGWHKD
jgi:hypothetical protein